jgi:hypothetical protein
MQVQESLKWCPQDVNTLVACLGRLPPAGKVGRITSPTAAEKLLDCVLSLHRPYDEFVVPRLDGFRRQCPDVNTLADLAQCVARHGGHVQFYKEVLDYDYPEAAQMFGRMLAFLLGETSSHPGATEAQSLAAWARNANVNGYKRIWVDQNGDSTNIPMFGIAGWQYLRMLFGADTCKPDVAVKGFAKGCLKKSLSGVSIVEVMEQAAPLVPQLGANGKPVREADRRIWNQYNTSNKSKKHKASSCRPGSGAGHQP